MSKSGVFSFKDTAYSTAAQTKAGKLAIQGESSVAERSNCVTRMSENSGAEISERKARGTVVVVGPETSAFPGKEQDGQARREVLKERFGGMEKKNEGKKKPVK